MSSDDLFPSVMAMVSCLALGMIIETCSPIRKSCHATIEACATHCEVRGGMRKVEAYALFECTNAHPVLCTCARP